VSRALMFPKREKGEKGEKFEKNRN